VSLVCFFLNKKEIRLKILFLNKFLKWYLTIMSK